MIDRKQPIEKKKEASVQQIIEKSEFSNYVPSVFSLPTLDILFGKTDKQDITLVSVDFETTSFGEMAIIEMANNKKYRTSSDVVVQKLHTAIQNGLEYPCRAILLRKGSGTNTYYDLI